MEINSKNIYSVIKQALAKLKKHDKFEEPERSICCGLERSYIYPRDCWGCGALFIAKKRK